jgi:hypothetical protein
MSPDSFKFLTKKRIFLIEALGGVGGRSAGIPIEQPVDAYISELGGAKTDSIPPLFALNKILSFKVERRRGCSSEGTSRLIEN